MENFVQKLEKVKNGGISWKFGNKLEIAEIGQTRRR